MSKIDSFGRDEAKRRELRAIKEALTAEGAKNYDNDAWRAEAAAVITETIYEGFESENLIDLIADVERVGFGDRVTVREARGLRAFWVGRGGYIEQSTIRSDVAEVPRDILGFKVNVHLDQLRTNFGETQANLIEMGTARMDAEVNARFLRAFQAAIQPGDANYVSSAQVQLPLLNQAVRRVQDETKGGQVAIIGRSTAIGSVSDAIMGSTGNGAGFLPESNEELLRRGVIGTYLGARVVNLVNHKDDMDVPFFPGNEILIVGRDAAKVAFYGGMDSLQERKPGEWVWEYQAKVEGGVLVHRPMNAARYVVSGLTP